MRVLLMNNYQVVAINLKDRQNSFQRKSMTSVPLVIFFSRNARKLNVKLNQEPFQSSTKLQLTTAGGGKGGDIEDGGLGGDDTSGEGGGGDGGGGLGGDGGGGFAPQFLGKPRIQFFDRDSLLIHCDLLGNKFGQLIDASFRPIFRLWATLGQFGQV